MKQYTGTKTVKAMPMTKTEAEEKLNRPIQSNEQDGYYIEYPDGYKSWSPKKTFEEAYKISETHLDRMRIEHAQLLDRYIKLERFTLTEEFLALPSNHREKIKQQNTIMYLYLKVLRSRIKDLAEGMESKSPIPAEAIKGTGRCDTCPYEHTDCKKLILADGSHICVKNTNPKN